MSTVENYKERVLNRNDLNPFLESHKKPHNKTVLFNVLIQHQLKNWLLIANAYEELKQIKTRKIIIDGTSFEIDFNPLRKINTTANADRKTVESKNCTLCPQFFYQEQKGIIIKDFFAIANPRPVIFNHITLAHRHQTQHINNSILLKILKLVHEAYPYRIFYHGPGAGASIPNHLHLQALPYNAPIEDNSIEKKRIIDKHKETSIYTLKFPSRVLVVEGKESTSMVKTISEILDEIEKLGYMNSEWAQHMVNIWTSYFPEKNIYRVFIIPRSKWRSHDYGLSENEIACSPGTLEMCGKILVANETTFEKLDEKLIRRVLEEVSMQEDDFRKLIKNLSAL